MGYSRELFIHLIAIDSPKLRESEKVERATEPFPSTAGNACVPMCVCVCVHANVYVLREKDKCLIQWLPISSRKMSDGKFVFLILKLKKYIYRFSLLCCSYSPPKHLSSLNSWKRLEEEEEEQREIEIPLKITNCS